MIVALYIEIDYVEALFILFKNKTTTHFHRMVFNDVLLSNLLMQVRRNPSPKIIKYTCSVYIS